MLSVSTGTGDKSSLWYRTFERWYMPSAYQIVKKLPFCHCHDPLADLVCVISFSSIIAFWGHLFAPADSLWRHQNNPQFESTLRNRLHAHPFHTGISYFGSCSGLLPILVVWYSCSFEAPVTSYYLANKRSGRWYLDELQNRRLHHNWEWKISWT